MENVLTAKPQRVIQFIIDGLHWKAPEKLRMPVLNALIPEGVYIRRSYMIVPHHPTVGDYGKLHSSSFPNPVLQEGNLFISPENKMLQELFSPEKVTAFIANTKAYVSVSRGFTINIHNQQLSDTEVVKESIALLRQHDIAYFRIHLQTPGNEGRYLSYTTPDKAYYRNIWGDQSPYVQAIEAADVLLGELIAELKNTDKWDTTLLVVTSDHGQSEQGWHPMIDEDSVVTPLLFTGPSVAKNRKPEYFEHTDITPTIAGIMEIEKPAVNGGSGIFIREVLALAEEGTVKHPGYIRTINRQLNTYNALRARIMIAGETNTYYSSLISYLENELLTPEPFYHQDRFLEWHKAGSTQHLINVNDNILQQMKKELSGRNAADETAI